MKLTNALREQAAEAYKNSETLPVTPEGKAMASYLFGMTSNLPEEDRGEAIDKIRGLCPWIQSRSSSSVTVEDIFG